MLNEAGMKVRPPRELIWNEYHDEQGIPDRWDAETPFNTYYGISLFHEGYAVHHDYKIVAAQVESLDDAKAAAAADCASRCSAYLSTIEKPESDEVREPGFDWTVSQETEQAMRDIDESIRAAHIQASTTFVGSTHPADSDGVEAGGWRSMDSAPKDGTRILALTFREACCDMDDVRRPAFAEVKEVFYKPYVQFGMSLPWHSGDPFDSHEGMAPEHMGEAVPIGWLPRDLLPTPPASAPKGGA